MNCFRESFSFQGVNIMSREINWVDKLIKQYSSEAYKLHKYRETLDKSDPMSVDEAETVSGMITDLRYAIDWMKRGRRPGNRKGAELSDVYRQRELMREIQSSQFSGKKTKELVLILLDLSERERTCFLLHMAHGLTYAEIGARLKVSRATVQRFVERARDKIQRAIA